MTIANWDSNPDNNDAAPPAGAPEGTTLVSDLNNIIRQVMADVRAWYELQWTDLGLALEASGGANEIVLTGDQAQYFEQNQRVQYLDGAGTQVSTIVAISVATNTTLTVLDTVTHPVSQVWVGTKPSQIPAILIADIVGNVIGNVTGNLAGVHENGSIASGVTGATQATGDDSSEMATTGFVQQELANLPAPLFNAVASGVFVGSATPSYIFETGMGDTIQFIGNGHYRLSFDTPRPDTDYGVLATLNITPGLTTTTLIDNVTVNGFDVRVNATGTGAGVNADRIAFTVYILPAAAFPQVLSVTAIDAFTVEVKFDQDISGDANLGINWNGVVTDPLGVDP